MRSRSTILFSILITLTVGLFLLDLAVGAVNIPIRDVWAALTGGNCSRATEKIVLNIRLIKAIVALLAGAALSVSGLQMQRSEDTRLNSSHASKSRMPSSA